MSNAQNKIKGLELGSNVINELNYELKLAYKDLNNFKEIEKEIRKENTILKDQVTHPEGYKQKYEDMFTQGDEKFEKLFKMG